MHIPERRILCVSFDRVVSENRSATLKEAGYDVTATTSVKEAVEWLSQEKFDDVIVGHRFPAEEKYVLAVEAKEKSSTPVLLVCGATRDSEIPATSRVYALEGSAGLLSALSALFPAAAEGRSQAAA
jgi:DNA-binding response OmpR family regulator